MVEIRQYECKACSKGCSIKVELLAGRVREVAGHGCQKGKDMVIDSIMMD